MDARIPEVLDAKTQVLSEYQKVAVTKLVALNKELIDKELNVIGIKKSITEIEAAFNDITKLHTLNIKPA